MKTFILTCVLLAYAVGAIPAPPVSKDVTPVKKISIKLPGHRDDTELSLKQLCWAHHEKARAHTWPIKDTLPATYDDNLAALAQKGAEHSATFNSITEAKTDFGRKVVLNAKANDHSSPDAMFPGYIPSKHKAYDFGAHFYVGPKGKLHFTQVVWKQTNKIGCGIAERKDKFRIFTYMVVRYTPSGQAFGQMQYSERPLK